MKESEFAKAGTAANDDGWIADWEKADYSFTKSSKEVMDFLNSKGGITAIREEIDSARKSGNGNAPLNAELTLLKNELDRSTSLRFSHAIVASTYGAEHNDHLSKIKAKSIINTMRSEDPYAFESGPHAAELRGAHIQLGRNEKIDLAEGKAAAIAYSQDAKKLRKSEPAMQTSNDAENEIVTRLAMAKLSNSLQADAELARVREGSAAGWRSVGADLSGALSTFGVGHALSIAQKAIPAVAALDSRIGATVSIAGGLITGGLVNNYIRGNELSSTDGLFRNASVSSLAFVALKGLNALPNPAVATGETASALAHGGRIAGTMAIGGAFASAYKGFSIVSGDREEGVNYKDMNQLGKEIGIAGVKGAFAAALIVPLSKSALSVLEANIGNGAAANAFGKAGGQELLGTAISTGALFAQSGWDKFGKSYEAEMYALRADKASQLIDSIHKVESEMAKQKSFTPIPTAALRQQVDGMVRPTK